MRYVIGFLISIGLLILVFVLIFRGPHSTTAPNTPKQLTDYANTTTQVRLTDDYPVSANQTHRQVVTTVGKDQTVFQVKAGYEGQVLRSQNYGNNPTSYANFLRALQLSGYATGDNSPAKADERGYCPLGHRYIYEIVDGNRVIQHYWSTSCGKGTFKGQATTVRTLFQRQVPDFVKLTSNLNTATQ